MGIIQKKSNGFIEVCKVTFGSEPKDNEIYMLLLNKWWVFEFSPAIATDEIMENRINPKRMQRQISKQINQSGTSTKSHQALKMQHEQNKTARKENKKHKKEQYDKEQFMLRQKKKKAKRKGK